MKKPIESLIDSVVRCTKCGAKPGTCNCWTQCERCSWWYETGGECRHCKYLATLEADKT